MVTGRKHERKVRLETTKSAIKPLQFDELPEATVEKGTLPSAGLGNRESGGNVDQTNKGVILPRQISACIKPRQPLRFFPDVLPINSRNLGKRLTIHLNEKGQRRVAWTSQLKAKLGE